jgi:hypothetical protein
MVLLALPDCMDTLWLSHLAVGECVIKNNCEWNSNRNSAIPGPTLWLPLQLLTLCCRLACWNCGSLWSSLCILYQIYQLPKALVDLWFRALAHYYFKFLLDFWFFFLVLNFLLDFFFGGFYLVLQDTMHTAQIVIAINPLLIAEFGPLQGYIEEGMSDPVSWWCGYQKCHQIHTLVFRVVL